MTLTAVRPGQHLEVTALVGVAARNAASVDGARGLPAESVAGLVDAGFARHFVPGRWNGAAGGFAELVEAVIEVGTACTSTAWCATLFAGHGRIAAYLPEPAQQEIWDRGPDTLISAAVMPPAGRATPVPGGWRLRGEWCRASGVGLADWVLLASRAPDDGGETVRIFAVPVADCTVRETWRPIGLRATDTNTVVVDDLLVPAHRTVTLPALLDVRQTGRPRCHCVPFSLVAAVMFAAPVVGAAAGAVADGLDTGWLTGDPDARQALARSASEVSAARLLLRDAATRADRGMVDPRTVARNRCDAAVAAQLSVSAVDRLFAARAGLGLAEDDPVQRRWREVHVAITHGTLRFASAADAYATAMLG
ncbi:acyl-CoA dehydrogenase family protein [Paractinoplanes ferrugineus]|uniref:Oxidoreductase mmfh n=1 Tax=Paractinoplanes ferrugineus TaxID=113564 RepID=A0A919J483_9ACTN|nr:acyl-CoA dehydrogenase family protein [Actinoplanes ferrugineus]GIE13092.1 oxidoreductase mmfh [Actinoplanes ferrugineus]